jgi:hypothetical protein
MLSFFFNIKIYQHLNKVDQDEDDGGLEKFTDYVSSVIHIKILKMQNIR